MGGCANGRVGGAGLAGLVCVGSAVGYINFPKAFFASFFGLKKMKAAGRHDHFNASSRRAFFFH